MFDGQRAQFNYFSGPGKFLDIRLCDGPAIVKQCAAAFEAAWERTIPHQEYRLGPERFGAVIRTLLETGPEAGDLWRRHEIALPRRHSAIRVRHDRGAAQASTLMTSLPPRTWLMVAWLPEGLQPPGR